MVLLFCRRRELAVCFSQLLAAPSAHSRSQHTQRTVCAVMHCSCKVREAGLAKAGQGEEETAGRSWSSLSLDKVKQTPAVRPSNLLSRR